ncbi:MAG: bifunctional serine/threonine-protein kinase/formylglycine-generating enzyme family protein [Pseudomonadota bacterium]|nr:bifunctional serine/threonine-protein kinase/formylglycine-generating enzyme family protein [Pseudomonadota bacterium]
MIQVPGYLIKREVGVGGMAMVYLAVQTSLEREVALKVMNPAMVSDPSFSRRFMQEARTLASLSHPNIVAVYDVGITEEKLHYFSMQHLPNGDFLKRIHHGAPESEAVRVLAGVARALGYAHQRGFVHRDVAPGNVLFDINDNPVLTDFGIARAVTKTSRITNAGVSVGTSHYMSPEQARGGDVDGRSDIYSLGALAFEAVTGNPPYNGDDGFAIAYAHVFEPVPRLPDDKLHWQTLIDRAMAKDPNERFQNTEEFLAELARLEPRIGSARHALPSSTAAGAPTVALPLPVMVPVTALSHPLPVLPAKPAAMPEPMASPLTGQVSPSAVATDPLTPAAAATSAAPSPSPVHLDRPTPLANRAVPRSVQDAVDDSAAVAPTPAAAKPSRVGWVVFTLVLAGALLVALGMWQQRGGKENAISASIKANTRPPPEESTPQETVTDVRQTIEPAQTTDPVAGDGIVADDLATADLLATDAALDPAIEAQMRNALAITVVDPIAFLTSMGRADIAAQRLSQPPGRNATDRYRLLLRMRPEGIEAKMGLLNTGRAFAKIAAEKLAEGKISEWIEGSQRAIEVAGAFDTAGELKSQFERQRTALITPLLATGAQAIEKWDEPKAKAAFERALLIAPGNKEASDGLKRASGIGKPGYAFTDVEGAKQSGPAMMVAAVAGKRLAIARGEISVAEFRRFWAGEGSRTRSVRPSCRDRESLFRSSRSRTWQAPGFNQGADHPVVCVSWDDAKAYVDWLSKATGKRYRLLDANEWSALARSANKGDTCRANVGDQQFNATYRDRAALSCADGFAETAPARRFAAAAGIHDLAGNVREWVSDCESGCRKHLAMGSAWASNAAELDLAQRHSFDTDTAFNTVGLRVAREVD